jgi:predicted dehydrogenase
MSEKTRIGILGAGHWGPNLVRCFRDSHDTEVGIVCDRDEARLALVGERYPSVRTVRDADEVFGASDIDAVVIATPTETHARFARAALEAGKHVLVEKPLSTDIESAEALVELAAKQGRVLMVGHIFLYNLAVREVRNIIGQSDFGKMRYMYARRTNLGPVRGDVHAGWDLAAHDVSIFLYLKGAMPKGVTASAQTFIQPGIPDLVFATLYFDDGTVAHFHTSWLDPQKVRQLVVVGEGKMLVFDDMNMLEPVRIYNKGLRAEKEKASEVVDTFGAFRVVLMQGDVVVPPLSTGEPLRQECQAFIEAIRTGDSPLSDGRLGADVVRVLSAIDRSIEEDSRRVEI